MFAVLHRLKSLFEKKPAPQFQHPDLGVLTFDFDTLWNGKVRRHGRDISIFIQGTETGPNPTLLDALPSLLSKFPELDRAARQLLCPPEAAPVTPDEFTFESLDLPWPDRPTDFMLTFTLKGDPEAIWHVEFEAGRPRWTGRDS